MKKFVIMADHGKWEKKNGKTIIHGEVLDAEIFAEYDTIEEAYQAYRSLKSIYDENGVWTSFSVEKRAAAKKRLAHYQNKRG